jgi:hypothetical protein
MKNSCYIVVVVYCANFLEDKIVMVYRNLIETSNYYNVIIVIIISTQFQQRMIFPRIPLGSC